MKEFSPVEFFLKSRFPMVKRVRNETGRVIFPESVSIDYFLVFSAVSAELSLSEPQRLLSSNNQNHVLDKISGIEDLILATENTYENM